MALRSNSVISERYAGREEVGYVDPIGSCRRTDRIFDPKVIRVWPGQPHSAARAVLGRTVTVSRERRRPIALEGAAAQALVTVHPSYLLRLPDGASKQREHAAFVADLRQAAAMAAA